MCAMLKLRSGGRCTTRIQTDRSGIVRCVSSFVRTRIEERCRAPAHRGAVERLVGVFVLVNLLVYVSGGDRLLMRAASLSLDGMCRCLRCLKSGQEACARPEFRPAPTLPDACADARRRRTRNEHQLAARYSGSSGLSRRVRGVHLTWWRVRRAPAQHASTRVWAEL